MRNANLHFFIAVIAALLAAAPLLAQMNQPVKVESGLVAGAPGDDSSITAFRGIPFAAPPVFEPPKPNLEFMARFEVELDAPVLEIGEVEGSGNRRIIPITGGKFEGPKLKGRILNNGADWQLVQADGLARLDTRYALRTDDGALIYIQTRGFRHGPADVLAEVAKGNPVDPGKYYFRVYIQFETGDFRYEWLNRAMAVGSGMRLRNAVIYDAYIIR